MSAFTGKIVLITGAAGGFGREMTRQFLKAGSFLILADRDPVMLHQAATDVAAALSGSMGVGKILGYVAADLSTADGADKLYHGACAISSTIDILVNNAGIGQSGMFTDVPQPAWEQLMQVNLLAPMRLTSKFLPAMIARKTGHIVNISSVAGLVGAGGLSTYAASKFGLRGFSEALANDVERYGIAVTTIFPFYARTPILQSLQYGRMAPQTVPATLLYEPAFVVAALLDGISKRKRSVYPGGIPKFVNVAQRLAPWLGPIIMRRLERSTQPPAMQPRAQHTGGSDV